jgi:ABC-2 type transport system ATP-binding protein
MENQSAIKIIGVKKKFKSYIDKAGSFKERFLRPNSKKHEEIWVLRGIDLDIIKGEVVGIIGKNGCGKSTLLKLLTKILHPNEGKIETRGRVSSLIELGAGFHPDMSGRENIYTNASIFGIKHKEVDQRMDDIIRFSELEEFIDQPVRTYSSGMYMRLAFAVAINVNADILLIDEILAVGDAAFQKKCFEKMKEIKANGTTIVIVSHSMDQLYKICDRLVWIENGLIKDEGVPRLIGATYLAEMEDKRLERIDYENQQIKGELESKIKEEEAKQNDSLISVFKNPYPNARRGGNGQCVISNVEIIDEKGNDVRLLETGLPYTVKVLLNNIEQLKEVTLTIGFTRDDGIECYGNHVNINQLELTDKLAGNPILFKFKNLFLSGKYYLDLCVQSPDRKCYDKIDSLTEIQVLPNKSKQCGIFSMESVWE